VQAWRDCPVDAREAVIRVSTVVRFVLAPGSGVSRPKSRRSTLRPQVALLFFLLVLSALLLLVLSCKDGLRPEDLGVVPDIGYVLLGTNAQGYDEYLWLADSAVMIEIPAGWFTRGSNDDRDEQPVREIYLDEFLLDKYEVTNRRYKKYCDATGTAYPPDPSFPGMPNYFTSYPDYPVVMVSWNDAKAYCDWADKRFPTEAEWERAARGTDEREFPWGNSQPDGTRCNIWENDDGYDYTSPVGNYPAGVSPCGGLDMAGNVWEWVNDWYAADYYGQSPAHNPPGPSSGSRRVVRGGSWGSNAWDARCARRCGYVPSFRGWSFGFRCSARP